VNGAGRILVDLHDHLVRCGSGNVFLLLIYELLEWYHQSRFSFRHNSLGLRGPCLGIFVALDLASDSMLRLLAQVVLAVFAIRKRNLEPESKEIAEERHGTRS
jgi:hypothetical protein